MEKYIIIAAFFFTVGCFVAAKLVKFAHEVELKFQEVYEYVDHRINLLHSDVASVVKQTATDAKNLDQTVTKVGKAL